jgi:N6-L-threonylcarbamoyladenine synthase
VLSKKTADAARREGARSVLLSGGVAANGPLREAIIARSPVDVFVPPPVLCTDNGAMIAACAHHRFDALVADWNLDPQPGMKFC